MKLLRAFKSLPVQLVTVIIIGALFAETMPLKYIQVFYTLSVVFKELLMAVLPIVIFSYITGAILSMQSRAPMLIAAIIGCVVLSNALGINFSYFVTTNLLPHILPADAAIAAIDQALVIQPMFHFVIPDYVTPDQAMLAGVIGGLLFSFCHVPKVNQLAVQLRHYVTLFLQKVFIPLLPVYVFGFVLKIQHEGALELLFQNYAQVFMFTIVYGFVFMYLLYFIGAGFSHNKAIAAIKEMFPAILTGFSTMSSAATMPITLEATEINTKNPRFAQLIIPSTANIHLVADSVITLVLVFSVMMMMGMEMPSYSAMITFTGYYVIARFSTAAIPGGGIIVLMPYLQSVFGMSAEAASIVTTLYILQDPIITAGNITGNGAFAMIVNRLTRRLQDRSA